MPENEKRIALRVDPEIWEKWDDKRHKERTSFQELGMRLFAEWFSGQAHGRTDNSKQPDGTRPVPVLKNEQSQNELTYYRAQMAEAAKKAAELAGILTAAIGGQIESSTEASERSTEEIMRDFAKESGDALRFSDETAARLQEDQGQSGKGKRSAHRKAPGGAA